MKARKKNRLIYGVGVNDSGTAVHASGETGACPLYGVWKNMLQRCYSDKWRAKHPSYSAACVTADWLYFSRFREWAEQQDWRGKQLDKDILFEGNKLYSPDTCVFVPRALNMFLVNHGAAQGAFPIGVHYHRARRCFVAQCTSPTTRKTHHLGCFGNEADAHAAWRRAKHAIALTYAAQQTDIRIAIALSNRFRDE